MKLLVIAATEAEIAPFLQQKVNADILITGVGMVATTYALTKQLATNNYDLVIQAGVGGSFDETIPLGTTVFVTADTWGDLGAEDNDAYIDIYGLGLLDKDELPHTEGMLRNPLQPIHNGIQLRQVNGITVNTVSGNTATIARRRLFGCEVESMEGAAFHYVCLREGVAFAQVRAISNYVIPRDKSQWRMKEAIISLNNWLIDFTSGYNACTLYLCTQQKTNQMKLTLGFSPCPNDTFIFDAMVNGLTDTHGITFDYVMEDVETLNQWALEGKLDITKLSYSTFLHTADKYALLHSGSALGMGVGPLLVAKQPLDMSRMHEYRIAIPGVKTTANLLFSLAYPQAKNKTEMLFSEIENAVLNGDFDAGLIIHESRFTYADKGLVKLADMGDWWEETTGAAIPLGGIVMRRSLGKELGATLDDIIRNSLVYSWENYPQLSEFVKNNAQEMQEDVMLQHIDLYVNKYTTDLGTKGRKAIATLFEKAKAANLVSSDIPENIFY